MTGPDRLTLPATFVLVAVALLLAFGAAVLVGGGPSPVKPPATRGSALVQRTPRPAVNLELTAAWAIPALQAPRDGRVQPRIAGGSVSSALALVSAPVSPAGSARATPTAVPRGVEPPRAVPTPGPNPEPATPESSGDFDTTGEPVTEGTPQRTQPNRRSGGVAKE
jgi:hypothetical protein